MAFSDAHRLHKLMLTRGPALPDIAIQDGSAGDVEGQEQGRRDSSRWARGSRRRGSTVRGRGGVHKELRQAEQASRIIQVPCPCPCPCPCPIHFAYSDHISRVLIFLPPCTGSLIAHPGMGLRRSGAEPLSGNPPGRDPPRHVQSHRAARRQIRA